MSNVFIKTYDFTRTSLMGLGLGMAKLLIRPVRGHSCARRKIIGGETLEAPEHVSNSPLDSTNWTLPRITSCEPRVPLKKVGYFLVIVM